MTPGWLLRWVDNYAGIESASVRNAGDRVDWLRCIPFIAMHVACVAVFWTGASVAAVSTAVVLYVVRMFAITGFYHRYFSHRSFKTSRWLQALMAWVGCTSVQRDPMWWASHHAHHHAHSDDPPDPHSPSQRGFLRSHIGWFMTPDAFLTRRSYVRDWARYPELLFLNRFDWAPPLVLALGLFGVGELLATFAPGLATNGWQMLVWGFFLSTIALHHATFTVNSLAHTWGARRYETGDHSRNNLLIAVLTLGEGWHNNHHHYPGSTRQGFYWWEFDFTYYVLWLFERLGLVWDLRPVPAEVLARNRVDLAPREAQA
ncbi:MAG: acyl-CoA desaturase [Acidobacteria bacterium]|nr:acyl-CoA desaturase [Acidobacteriota bacterium]